MIAPPLAPAVQPAPAAAPRAAPQPTVVVVAKPTRPTGDTLLRCTVTLTGVVKTCEIASESPAGVGLGESAMKLAARFRVEPPLRDGRPVEGPVLLPFKFQLAGEDGPSSPPPAQPPRR